MLNLCEHFFIRYVDSDISSNMIVVSRILLNISECYNTIQQKPFEKDEQIRIKVVNSCQRTFVPTVHR